MPQQAEEVDNRRIEWISGAEQEALRLATIFLCSAAVFGSSWAIADHLLCKRQLTGRVRLVVGGLVSGAVTGAAATVALSATGGIPSSEQLHTLWETLVEQAQVAFGEDDSKERVDALRALELEPVRRISTKAAMAQCSPCGLVRHKAKWLREAGENEEAERHLRAAAWMERAEEARDLPIRGRVAKAHELYEEITDAMRLLPVGDRMLLGFDWVHGGIRSLVLVDVERDGDGSFILRYFSSSPQLADHFASYGLPSFPAAGDAARPIMKMAEMVVGAERRHYQSVEYRNVCEDDAAMVTRPLLLAATAKPVGAVDSGDMEMAQKVGEALKTGNLEALQKLFIGFVSDPSLLAKTFRAGTGPVRAQNLDMKGVALTEAMGMAQAIAMQMRKNLPKGLMRSMKESLRNMLPGYNLDELMIGGMGPGYYALEATLRDLDQVDGVTRRFLGKPRVRDENQPFSRTLKVYERVVHPDRAPKRQLKLQLLRLRSLLRETERIANETRFRGLVWDEIQRVEATR